MHYRVFAMLASVFVLLPSALVAQEDETWYFALKPETGEVVAYTASGVVNTVLDGGIEWEWEGWRLGARTVVAPLQSDVDREVTLYKLTPESAQPLAFVFDADDLNSPMNRPDYLAAYSPPSIVIAVKDRVEYGPFYRGLLINADTGAVEVLENLTHWLYCCRFSADGRALRYVTGDETDESVTLTLKVRTLNTGEERIVHTLVADSRYTVILPDLHGARWLRVETRETEETTFQTVKMLFLDGAVETIAEEEYESLRDMHEWEFLGDNLLVYSYALCQRDCFLELYRPGDNSPLQFTLPPPVSDGTIGGIFPVQLVGDNDLLIYRTFNEAGYWLLKQHSAPTFIGTDSVGYIVGRRTSKNGRWVLVTDTPYDPEQYSVWDNSIEEFVLTGKITTDNAIEMRSTDEIVLVQDINAGAGKLYRSIDRAVIELPEGGTYFEILPDGTLLTSRRADGHIYHYNPENGAFTLLVEDAQRFW